MPTRHPLTVSLTPELAALVAREVASGRYATASEVVRAALRLLAFSATPALHGAGAAAAPASLHRHD